MVGTALSKVDTENDESVHAQLKLQSARLIGELGVRVVAHVFQRPLLGKFQSASAIALAWYESMVEMFKLHGFEMPVECPDGWAKANAAKAGPSEKSTKPPQRSASSSMQEQDLSYNKHNHEFRESKDD